MTFLGSIAGLLVVLVVAHGVGWHLAGLAPWRLRPSVRNWLSPVLGIAVLLVALVPIGWFGPGFANGWVRGGLAAAIGALLIPLLRQPGWWRSTGQIALFGLVATWPFTAQLLRFGCFDILNDPWTYCVQSQWFQHHGLAESIPCDNAHGALSQVYFTQLTGTRAAAQFGQAAIQSLLGLEWAHEAYPIAVCTGMAAGSLTVAFFASIGGTRRSRFSPWLAGLLLTFTLNGFGLGALRGYLPQTVGLPLAAAGCGVWALLVARSSSVPPSSTWRSGILAGILLASATYAYSEILPFLLLGCAAPVAVKVFCRPHWKTLAGSILATAGTFLVLAGAELPRALHALIGQSKSVVGEGIPWHPWQFAAHALGGLSGYTDGGILLGNSAMVAALAMLLIGGLLLCGAGAGWRPGVRGGLVPSAAIFAVFLLFFLYFRYCVNSPFQVGTGQSWSQYKLANWSSIFLFSVVGVGITHSRSRWRPLVVATLCMVVAVGGVQAWDLAAIRTERLRKEVGTDQTPFTTLTELSREIRRSTTGPIFLDFSAARAKSRQLLAYLLPPGTAIADWSDDVFVAWMLPFSERNAARTRANWVVQYAPRSGFTPAGTRLGNYRLHRQTRVEAALLRVVGGYPTEQYSEGTLNWVRDSIRFEFIVPAGVAATTAHVEAEIVSLVPGLEFSLTASPDEAPETRVISLPESHQAWNHAPRLNAVVPLPEAPDRKLSLEFRTANQPGVIGGQDQRELTFFVRNLHVWIDVPVSPSDQPQ